MGSKRLAALYRFGFAITLLNILGHTVFGFEQSWAQPLVALLTGYSMELLLEAVDAGLHRRRPAFAGGFRAATDFLVAAHITSLAVAMLIYTNDRLWPVAFAVAAAIGSKAIFRVAVGDRVRHFFNPSNIGITATLLLFPWVGIAPPYHFTENLLGAWNWIVPGIIVVSGSFLNGRMTGRMPLILAWVGAFAVQAVLRAAVFGTPFLSGLSMMTGVAFVLFTFYMISDPGTTPRRPRDQVLFGSSVALAYGFLMAVHVVFGLFFALSIISALRGIRLHYLAWARSRERGAGEVALPLPGGVALGDKTVAFYSGERAGGRS
jgi:hypothetical protein